MTPSRRLPIPEFLSAQAKGVLSLEPGTIPYPELTDLEGWRTLVESSDAQVAARIGEIFAQVPAERSVREVAGVRVFTVTPEQARGDDRVVLWIHGGALIFLGGACCSALTVRQAARLGLTTLGPDYRTAPDHPFPTPVEDCLGVYRALLEEHPADRIVLSAESAGGNFATAMLLRARDDGLPMPAAFVLDTPEVDLTESGDSFRANLGADTVLQSLMPINLLYAAGADLADPYVSPLFADHTGFPPTILTTGTRDLFLSNTVRLHRALRRVGVEAELHVLEAGVHGGFQGLAPEDKEIDEDVIRFVERHCPPQA